jgi:hypothetical protein
MVKRREPAPAGLWQDYVTDLGKPLREIYRIQNTVFQTVPHPPHNLYALASPARIALLFTGL